MTAGNVLFLVAQAIVVIGILCKVSYQTGQIVMKLNHLGERVERLEERLE